MKNQTTRDTIGRRMLARVLAPVALAAVLTLPTHDAEAARLVCDDAGRCTSVSAPKGRELKREARKLERDHAVGWEYVGRTGKKLGRRDGLHLVKSDVKRKTWHVFELARRTPTAGGPRVLVCERGRLTLSDNLRVGSCVYPGARPRKADVAKRWPGFRVSVSAMSCGRGRWIAPDRGHRARWGYCEGGKPTKAAKRWAKRHPLTFQARVTPVRPEPIPDPKPTRPACDASRFPTDRHIGESYVYPETRPVCLDGRLTVTPREIVEDAYGWNIYVDGGTGTAASSRLPELDRGCLTDPRDGYTMCADGRVYLRTSSSGRIVREWQVWRIPA